MTHVFLLFFIAQPSARPPHTRGLRSRPGGGFGLDVLFADRRKTVLWWGVLGEMEHNHKTKPERLALL
jgi:hypothetical protein